MDAQARVWVWISEACQQVKMYQHKKKQDEIFSISFWTSRLLVRCDATVRNVNSGQPDQNYVTGFQCFCNFRREIIFVIQGHA
jgi:hypothetical protein